MYRARLLQLTLSDNAERYTPSDYADPFFAHWATPALVSPFQNAQFELRLTLFDNPNCHASWSDTFGPGSS
jgi:hypothetical protein